MLTKSNQRFAIIDLGSNSFYMVLGSVLPSHIWQIEHQVNEAVQLRAGLTQEGELSWESINRALTCLEVFGARLASFDPDPRKVRIVGTAALRLAQNRALFLSHATKKLGYPIEVISGEEEAELIYLAFIQYLYNAPGPLGVREKILGIDIGGGSTELVVGLAKEPRLSVSLPIGCVELQGYFLGKSQVNADNFSLARGFVKDQLMLAEGEIQRLVDFGWQQVYAGSGSADILVQVARFLELEEEGAISIGSLRQIQDYLISLKEYEALKILGLKDHQLRILPGLVVIFSTLMTHLQVDKITVLPVALRHGVLAAMRLSTLQPLRHNN